jgi:hypothetical protein
MARYLDTYPSVAMAVEEVGWSLLTACPLLIEIAFLSQKKRCCLD